MSEYVTIQVGGATITYLPAEPASAMPSIPTVVSLRQAKLSLLAHGVYDAVLPAIQAMPSPHREAALIEWNDASTVERNSPLVQTLGPLLGLNAAALDGLFEMAATL